MLHPIDNKRQREEPVESVLREMVTGNLDDLVTSDVPEVRFTVASPPCYLGVSPVDWSLPRPTIYMDTKAVIAGFLRYQEIFPGNAQPPYESQPEELPWLSNGQVARIIFAYLQHNKVREEASDKEFYFLRAWKKKLKAYAEYLKEREAESELLLGRKDRRVLNTFAEKGSRGPASLTFQDFLNMDPNINRANLRYHLRSMALTTLDALQSAGFVERKGIDDKHRTYAVLTYTH